MDETMEWCPIVRPLWVNETGIHVLSETLPKLHIYEGHRHAKFMLVYLVVSIQCLPGGNSYLRVEVAVSINSYVVAAADATMLDLS
jgi:hypothetical protein